MLSKKTQSGLTLLEIMISLALLSIVAASAISMFVSGQTMNKLNHDKQLVYKALQEAVSQIKKEINTGGAAKNKIFIQKTAFDVVNLTITLKGAGNADLHFDDDGEEVQIGTGTQFGRVVVESVNLENQTVNLEDAKLFKITAEVKANYSNGGSYLDENLTLLTRK